MSKSVEPREDFLEEDPEIPGQKFCLLSFLSPEKVLADKNIFMFNKFLQIYEFSTRTKNMENYLMQTLGKINTHLNEKAAEFEAKDLSGAAQLCRSSLIRMDVLMDEFQEFVKKNQKELQESKLREQYDDFMYANKVKLEDEFYQKNEFRTTVRGLKIRGVYGSQGEAVARSKKLQRTDPLHNIFVAEVGKWLPWDPEPSDVKEQEYAEDQLNMLMKKYKENEEQREQFQREQRSRAGAAKKTGGQESAGITMTRVEESTTTTESKDVESVSQQMAGMFMSDGPADLAIQRKMEAADASKQE